MNDVRYLGERDLRGRAIVVRSAGDDKRLLDPRPDLAPGLPVDFDWGPLSRRPACDRLAVAILADALAGLPDGDELALAHGQAYARDALDRLADGWCDVGAWAARRWVAERTESRGTGEQQSDHLLTSSLAPTKMRTA